MIVDVSSQHIPVSRNTWPCRTQPPRIKDSSHWLVAMRPIAADADAHANAMSSHVKHEVATKTALLRHEPCASQPIPSTIRSHPGGTLRPGVRQGSALFLSCPSVT